MNLAVISVFLFQLIATQGLQQVLRHNVPTEYEAITGLFEQSDPSTNNSYFNDHNEGFGLKQNVEWKHVINELHKHESGDTKVKLLFLSRHGQGFHNIVSLKYNDSEWVCKWQMEPGNGDITWFDAELTKTGLKQMQKLSETWDQEIYNNSCPFPQSFYTSPMTRTLQTLDLTWATKVNFSVTKPVVKEFLRETYGIGTDSKRHNKSYIHDNWPYVEFESGFTETDTLWTPDSHESHQHRNYRARRVLNDIFVHDPNPIISITSHLGLLKSLLKELKHRKWYLETGQVLPVVVKACKFNQVQEPDLKKPWKHLSDYCDSEHTLVDVGYKTDIEDGFDLEDGFDVEDENLEYIDMY